MPAAFTPWTHALCSRSRRDLLLGGVPVNRGRIASCRCYSVSRCGMSAAAAGSSRHLPVVVSETAQTYGRAGSTCSAHGIRGETVTGISQRLLAHYGGLRGRFRLAVAELAQ